MKQLAFLLLSVLMLLAVTACWKKTAPKTQPLENTQNSLTEETSDERTDTGMKMYINDKEIPVTWENNPSVSALRSDLQAGDIVVSMSMYSNNEQVGPLNKSYPSNESPSGAFKRQSGLAQQDGGALPRQARRDLR